MKLPPLIQIVICLVGLPFCVGCGMSTRPPGAKTVVPHSVDSANRKEVLFASSIDQWPDRQLATNSAGNISPSQRLPMAMSTALAQATTRKSVIGQEKIAICSAAGNVDSFQIATVVPAPGATSSSSTSVKHPAPGAQCTSACGPNARQAVSPLRDAEQLANGVGMTDSGHTQGSSECQMGGLGTQKTAKAALGQPAAPVVQLAMSSEESASAELPPLCIGQAATPPGPPRPIVELAEPPRATSEVSVLNNRPSQRLREIGRPVQSYPATAFEPVTASTGGTAAMETLPAGSSPLGTEKPSVPLPTSTAASRQRSAAPATPAVREAPEPFVDDFSIAPQAAVPSRPAQPTAPASTPADRTTFAQLPSFTGAQAEKFPPLRPMPVRELSPNAASLKVAVVSPPAMPTNVAPTTPGVVAADAASGVRVAVVQASAARAHVPTISAVSQRVHEHIRYGFSLANRGAIFSARAELVQALKLVALALDADDGTQRHSQAMIAGLTAMRESDDFTTRDSQVDVGIDVARLVASHETTVLKGRTTPATSPLLALQDYYAFAQQQLALAGGHESAASMALYGLARVQTVVGEQQTMSGPKAIALHQAALLVDPENYLAANELGVLLARYGQLAEAQATLQHSASVSPQPETWHNLARVHQFRNQPQLAAEAQQRCDELTAARLGGAVNGATAALVDWVDPATLAAANDPDPAPPVAPRSPPGSATSPPTGQAAAAAPWSFLQPISDFTTRLGNSPKR